MNAGMPGGRSITGLGVKGNCGAGQLLLVVLELVALLLLEVLSSRGDGAAAAGTAGLVELVAAALLAAAVLFGAAVLFSPSAVLFGAAGVGSC